LTCMTHLFFHSMLSSEIYSLSIHDALPICLTESDIQSRSPLRVIVRMHRRLPEGYQVEDVLVSDCILADAVVPRNQDGEVSEIQIGRATSELQSRENLVCRLLLEKK